MISNLLLVLAAAVFSAGLRSFQHPLVFRIGTLGIVGTSFLAGWLLGGSIPLGLALAASWLFLPWLEILTRVRHLRLPIDRKLEPRTPPGRGTFPGFEDITAEIEDRGFEHVEDIGWTHGANRHFYRVFSNPERKIQAAICLTEQEELAFYYLTLTSHTGDGRIFTTWNYPFSYGLKLQPCVVMQRISGNNQTFAGMLAAHEEWLRLRMPEIGAIVAQSPEEIVRTMQAEMRAQITHNISAGLLKRDGEHFIRYTVRGMFFLWLQFLRDLVRIS